LALLEMSAFTLVQPSSASVWRINSDSPLGKDVSGVLKPLAVPFDAMQIDEHWQFFPTQPDATSERLPITTGYESDLVTALIRENRQRIVGHRFVLPSTLYL